MELSEIIKEKRNQKRGTRGFCGLPKFGAVGGKASYDAGIQLSMQVDASVTLTKKKIG